jgi:hypothetical protein
MLIQDQVTVFLWLLYIKYGGLRLVRWVTLQHYFATALLKVAEHWCSVFFTGRNRRRHDVLFLFVLV